MNTLMNNPIVRQLSVVVTLVATLIINGMASSGALGGTPTAEISNAYPIYFVPANTTFAVWGLIYTGLIAYTVWQALPAQRENRYAQRTGWLFVFSGLANIVWLVLFQTEQFLLSVPVMVVLLLSLIAIYLRSDIGKAVHWQTRWFVQIPFSFYMAWITVATIANTSQALYANGVESFLGIDGAAWGAIMTVIGGIVISTVVFRGKGNIAYAAVGLWAFLGLAAKQVETPVAPAAIVMMVVIAAALAAGIWFNRGPAERVELNRKAGANA